MEGLIDGDFCDLRRNKLYIIIIKQLRDVIERLKSKDFVLDRRNYCILVHEVRRGDAGTHRGDRPKVLPVTLTLRSTFLNL